MIERLSKTMPAVKKIGEELSDDVESLGSNSEYDESDEYSDISMELEPLSDEEEFEKSLDEKVAKSHIGNIDESSSISSIWRSGIYISSGQSFQDFFSFVQILIKFLTFAALCCI